MKQTAPEIELPELDGKYVKSLQNDQVEDILNCCCLQDCKDVSRWQNLPDYSFQAIVGEE